MKPNLNIPDFINKLDDKVRYYVFIGILLLLFLLDYFVLMRPQLTTLTKMGPENKVLAEDIEKAKGDIQKLNSYRQQVAKIKNDITQISRTIRSKEELSLIMERISRMANRSNVIIDQIIPVVQDQEVLLSDNQRSYYSLPIRLELRAGYHDFGRFVNELEKDDMRLNINAFSITAGSDIHNHLIRLTIGAIVYEDKTQ